MTPPFPDDAEVDELVAALKLCVRALDALKTAEQRERLIRMLHGYTLTDWLQVEDIAVVMQTDTAEMEH